jgi:hypothetical protein
MSRHFPPSKLGRTPISTSPLAFVSPSFTTIHPLLLIPLPDLVPEISSYSALSSRIKHRSDAYWDPCHVIASHILDSICGYCQVALLFHSFLTVRCSLYSCLSYTHSSLCSWIFDTSLLHIFFIVLRIFDTSLFPYILHSTVDI